MSYFGFQNWVAMKIPKNCYVLGRKCNNLKAVLIINGIEAPQETKIISLTTNYANFTKFLKSPTDGTEDTNTKIINYRLSELHEQEVKRPSSTTSNESSNRSRRASPRCAPLSMLLCHEYSNFRDTSWGARLGDTRLLWCWHNAYFLSLKWGVGRGKVAFWMKEY